MPASTPRSGGIIDYLAVPTASTPARRPMVGATPMSGPLSKWFKIPTLAERLRSQGVREDLVQAAERTAFSRQADRELPAVGESLNADEAVVSVVEGRYARMTGLLVLTSRRLFFAPKTADRSFVTAIDLPDVLDVSARMHRGMGVLEVRTNLGVVVVDQILGNQADRLATSISQAASPPPDGPAAHRDPIEELAELRALHQAGAIEDAEFQIRKNQLFGQI